MKIAFVLQDLVHGGAQYVTALMVRGFIAKGYEVDLIVSRVHSEYIQGGIVPFEVPAQTNWIYLPHKKARKNVWALRHYLKNTEAVAIIAMSSNYTSALRFSSIGLWEIPSLYHVEHGIPGTRGLDLDPPIKRFSLKWWKKRWFYSKFKRILTVCEGGRKNFIDLTGCSPKKVVTVSNPVVDNSFFEKIKDPPKHPWLVDKVCPTFIAAGMHTPLKGHMLLLKVFHRLSKEIRARLIVFGRGELTSQYEKYIHDNYLEDVISLPGFTNNLPAELQKADALLVASWTESFSIVLVEALATGTPVISTDCNYGPREILVSGKYGTLIPVNDEDAYVDALKNFIIGHSIVNVNDKNTWERYTVDKIVNNYERALGLL